MPELSFPGFLTYLLIDREMHLLELHFPCFNAVEMMIMTTREYMLGNVAIARGLLEGGVQVAAGYPGTPSSEIIDTLAAREDRDDDRPDVNVGDAHSPILSIYPRSQGKARVGGLA